MIIHYIIMVKNVYNVIYQIVNNVIIQLVQDQQWI